MQNGKKRMVKFYVTKRENQTLLGMPAISDFELIPNAKIDELVNQSGMLDEYKDVFTGLGKVGDPVTLKLKPNAVPKAVPPR
jgi:hypothetical protein